jgi:hypothetical protein
VIFIRSVFAGFGALIVSLVLLLAGYLTYVSVLVPDQGGFSGAFETTEFLEWVILPALSIFLSGFAWEFRRASKRA